MRAFAALLAILVLGACVAEVEPPEPARTRGFTRVPAPSPEPGDPVKGRAFAQVNCSGCHAIGATGTSPYPPAPPFRTLSQKYDVEGLAEAFAEGILVGHKGQKQMPEFVLTTNQIDDLLAYLKTL